MIDLFSSEKHGLFLSKQKCFLFFSYKSQWHSVVVLNWYFLSFSVTFSGVALKSVVHRWIWLWASQLEGLTISCQYFWFLKDFSTESHTPTLLSINCEDFMLLNQVNCFTFYLRSSGPLISFKSVSLSTVKF